MLQLPIPIIDYNGQNITGFDVKKIPGGALADAKKAAERNSYLGIHEWNCGCLKSFISEDGTEITEKDEMRKLSRLTPFESAIYIGIQGVIIKSVDDGIEGVYPCPSCSHVIRAEKKIIDGEEIDTRDFISALPLNIMPKPYSKTWSVFLVDSVVITDKRTGEVLQSVESLTFHHVTLGDCIRVYDQNPALMEDKIRFQYQCWIEALEQINATPISKSIKSMYGMPIFERIDDFSPFTEMKTYGINPVIKKSCPKCRKEFETEINTANFFGSGLR